MSLRIIIVAVIILFSLRPVGRPPPSPLLSSPEALKGVGLCPPARSLPLSTKNSRYFSAYQKAAFRHGNVSDLESRVVASKIAGLFQTYLHHLSSLKHRFSCEKIKTQNLSNCVAAAAAFREYQGFHSGG